MADGDVLPGDVGRPRLSLRARRSHRTLRPLRALDALLPLRALHTLRSLRPAFTLHTLDSLLSLWPLLTLRALQSAQIIPGTLVRVPVENGVACSRSHGVGITHAARGMRFQQLLQCGIHTLDCKAASVRTVSSRLTLYALRTLRALRTLYAALALRPLHALHTLDALRPSDAARRRRGNRRLLYTPRHHALVVHIGYQHLPSVALFALFALRPLYALRSCSACIALHAPHNGISAVVLHGALSFELQPAALGQLHPVLVVDQMPGGCHLRPTSPIRRCLDVLVGIQPNIADVLTTVLHQRFRTQYNKGIYEPVESLFDRPCGEPVKDFLVLLSCAAELIRCRLYALA